MKITLAILAATAFIVLVGVWLFNKSSSSSIKVDPKLLIREDSAKISSPSASVTLVEFSDYQCPACGTYNPVVNQLIASYSGKLNFVYRNFPLNQHKNAREAAFFAESAAMQNKFWPMHDLFFDKQQEWSESNNAKELFIKYGRDLGLDTTRLVKDADSSSIKQKIDRDVSDGLSLGVNSTPTFYLNGEKLTNPASYEDFATLVKAALLKNPQSQAPEEKYHTHADFKVYLNDEAWDFSQAKYQSPEGKELTPDVHLHDGNGEDIHIHKKGVTLDTFFKSLGMSLSPDCFVTDTKEQFCNEGVKTLKMYVNAKPNNEFGNYQPQDLDKILITFGQDENEVQKQLSSISDQACLYSLKCPERGKPPTESCSGGLGSDCDK